MSIPLFYALNSNIVARKLSYEEVKEKFLRLFFSKANTWSKDWTKYAQNKTHIQKIEAFPI